MSRIAQIQQMLAEDPSDQFLQYALALEFIKIGERQAAVEALEHLSDDYLPKYYQLGKLLEEDEKIDQAIEVYKHGVALARKTGDLKTANELAEAIWMLD
ncbi:MAG: hypothetical protein GC193_12735 [Cryomorphaceae bacterium]|nr:hypothetical protein [Cryomorphaceae bacterium]